MQPIELLCEIAAQRCKVAVRGYFREPVYSAILAHGFLENAGVIQSVSCLNCDATHEAEIVYHAGRDGYFCPEAGFVPVSSNEIGAIRASLPKIAAALANAFECHARKSSPVRGETWRVGKVGIEAGDIAIYFHPTLQTEGDAAEFSAALAQEPRSRYRLVLTATGALSVGDAVVVPLSEVVTLDLSVPKFRAVADLRDLVGAPRKNPGGAPNRYGQALFALITRRIEDGRALAGRNEEARAVLADFKQSNPQRHPPSLSSVQDYVSKVRAGQ